MTGVGAGFFYSSITTAGVTALDPSRASLAGGLIYMFQIAGGAIGLGGHDHDLHPLSEDELADKAGAAGTQLTDHQTAVLHGVLAGTDWGPRRSTSSAPRPRPRSRRSSASRSSPGSRRASGSSAIAAVLGFLISLFFVGGRLLPGATRRAERTQT